MEIQNRVFVSFDGQCPYNCKHCFSFECKQQSPPRTINQIIDSLQDLYFDVVYVSQKRENFINPGLGLLLCEKLFERYRCNIVIITRNVFSDIEQERLLSLKDKMRACGKYLFIGVSVVGKASACFTEDLSVAPSPMARIEFAKKIYQKGLYSMLLIRPMFPETIIPSREWKSIVDQVAGSISCILSGALMVNRDILARLGLNETDLHYLDGGESEYLEGAIAGSMKFVDVRNELSQLKAYCHDYSIPFFEHSLPAINYLVNNS